MSFCEQWDLFSKPYKNCQKLASWLVLILFHTCLYENDNQFKIFVVSLQEYLTVLTCKLQEMFSCMSKIAHTISLTYSLASNSSISSSRRMIFSFFISSVPWQNKYRNNQADLEIKQEDSESHGVLTWVFKQVMIQKKRLIQCWINKNVLF